MYVGDIVIIGKGGFAREVSAYLVKSGNPAPALIHSEHIPRTGIGSMFHFLGIGDPGVRLELTERFEKEIWVPFLCLTKTAFEYEIGRGSILCPGSVITTNVKIGVHVIVNLNATIGHDCVIGDFVTISPGVHISGNVTIGNLCYIGSGAVIREKVTICDRVTVGAGAVVLKDITEPGTYIGVPAEKQIHLPDLKA